MDSKDIKDVKSVFLKKGTAKKNNILDYFISNLIICQ